MFSCNDSSLWIHQKYVCVCAQHRGAVVKRENAPILCNSYLITSCFTSFVLACWLQPVLSGWSWARGHFLGLLSISGNPVQCLCVRHSASFWLMKLNQLPGLLFPTFSSYCVAQKGSSHITSVSLICFLTAGALTYQLDWTEPFPSKGPSKASGLELPDELANSST